MSIEIIFLSSVSIKEKQAVLNFVDLWQNNDRNIVIYTSGSTGSPKKINVSKQAMVASAIATGKFFNFKKGDCNLLALSSTYIAGMMQIVRSIVFDMTLIVSPISSNPLKDLNDDIIDFAAFVPMQVQSILECKYSKSKYSAIKNIIIGGAPIGKQLFSELSKLENKSFATYGMTETVSHVALKEIAEGNDAYEALPEIYFEDNKNGCLVINAQFINQEPIVTNDRVELINNKSFRWLGRADFVINSGGVKIQPEVVENKLSVLISEMFYISKLSDDLLGEKVVLYIEGPEYAETILNQLKIDVLQLLSKYEAPKDIIFKAAFARTKTGKLIRE